MENTDTDTDTATEPVAATSPVQGTSIPILPARDIPETLALFAQLGFDVRHDEANGYAMVRRGAIEVHFTVSPDLDPWTSNGMAFIRLDDVTSLYEEFRATGAVPIVPTWSADVPYAERADAEIRAKWAAGESIARMGEVADKSWGIREFPLLDPSNNLLRFGQVVT